MEHGRHEDRWECVPDGTSGWSSVYPVLEVVPPVAHETRNHGCHCAGSHALQVHHEGATVHLAFLLEADCARTQARMTTDQMGERWWRSYAHQTGR